MSEVVSSTIAFSFCSRADTTERIKIDISLTYYDLLNSVIQHKDKTLEPKKEINKPSEITLKVSALLVIVILQLRLFFCDLYHIIKYNCRNMQWLSAAYIPTLTHRELRGIR